MDLYEAINSRRTVRDFEAKPISTEIIERIIEAAFKAPTNDHMRDWHYIIVRDKNVTAKLLDIIPKGITHEDMDALIKDWNLSDSIQQECYRNAVPKQYRMLFDASAVIIPLLKQKTDILHPDNVSHLNVFASIWRSIENIFLAATAEGYGCNLRIPLGNEAEYARSILDFPNDYFMPCFIGIGVPKSDIVSVTQKEINIKERIHWDRF
ncbi:MAG: nitroreductase family protein [Oscillospiraceae bacterium]|nr:nitroreductase family protein [Oscillospiraceae bacterium]